MVSEGRSIARNGREAKAQRQNMLWVAREQVAEPKLRLALTVSSLCHPLPSDTGHIAAISDPVVSVF